MLCNQRRILWLTSCQLQRISISNRWVLNIKFRWTFLNWMKNFITHILSINKVQELILPLWLITLKKNSVVSDQNQSHLATFFIILKLYIYTWIDSKKVWFEKSTKVKVNLFKSQPSFSKIHNSTNFFDIFLYSAKIPRRYLLNVYRTSLNQRLQNISQKFFKRCWTTLDIVQNCLLITSHKSEHRIRKISNIFW